MLLAAWQWAAWAAGGRLPHSAVRQPTTVLRRGSPAESTSVLQCGQLTAMKTNKLMCMYMALVHVAAFFGCAVLWRQPDFPHKLAELIVWYLVTGLGITAGCHRLW